jgi:hypothetical protein
MAERQRRLLHEQSLNHAAQTVTPGRKMVVGRASSRANNKCSAFDVGCSVFVLHHTRPDRIQPQRTADLLRRFKSRSLFAGKPGPARASCSSPDESDLSVFKKNNLVGPPPFIWPNAVEVPHPNATNIISIPVGIQTPGVPSGNFGEYSENPP